MIGIAGRRHRVVGAVDWRGSGPDGGRRPAGPAVVMRSGADSEMTSGLPGAETDIIKQAPGCCAREPANRRQKLLCSSI